MMLGRYEMKESSNKRKEERINIILPSKHKGKRCCHNIKKIVSCICIYLEWVLRQIYIYDFYYFCMNMGKI